MRRTGRLAGSRILYGAAAIAILVWAPIDGPSARVSIGAAFAIGAGGGTIVFLVLARRLPPLGRPQVAHTLALASPLVLVAAASEEAIWRFGVLGGLRAPVGISLALAISTAGFAASHVGRAPPRALSAHLLTGAAFGVVYITTGRLAAAIAAHAVYNALVIAACSAWPALLEPEPAA